ncbi:hypothetical protein DAPPUDRAFT_260942 [Daphnia pulex]|uniref:Uncharacterized protein n=1 Tax=Daphnia pulex TaxID=6669 RepID=E9HK59_DAPPU|nr:hypothetical protein DAPPUDRAFT_260942 [Daphnia pulex]|eukprot:EFX67890.1 hypothetical protein DAPPUDRAFT_260942 [Daphnia pulex]
MNISVCFLEKVMQRRRREDWYTKTSPVSPKCQRGSSFVVVNPLSATPLFSPARAALVGLVAYKPRGRRVAKPKLCRKYLIIFSSSQ